MEKITIQIDGIEQRLDRYVGVLRSTYSRGEIIRAIKAGEITVNGKSVKQGYKLREGDVVAIGEIEETIGDELIPNPELAQDLVVIEENENFVAFDKPRGLQAHPSTTEKKETLINAVVSRYPEIANVGDDALRPGIMHRLDKYTSGVMVIARTQEAHEALKDVFASRSAQKEYHALVWGQPKEDAMTIDLPIARSVGYTRQKVVLGNTRKFKGEAKDAFTEVKIEELYIIQLPQTSGVTNLTHVVAHPHTGRMHQIRVHLAHAGHPIVGDVKYEHKPHTLLNKKFFSLLPSEDLHTFYLHAHTLSFSLFGKEYAFTSELPEYFTKATDLCTVLK